MTEQITVRPATVSETTTSNPGQEDQKISLNRTQLVNLCGAGLGISFFLPWIQILGISASPFTMQKMGQEADTRLLWLIPIFSAITIFAGLAKFGQSVAARLTGLLPFFALVYWYKDVGNDLMNVLSYGAYLAGLFGAALVILPPKSK